MYVYIYIYRERERDVLIGWRCLAQDVAPGVNMGPPEHPPSITISIKC